VISLEHPSLVSGPRLIDAVDVHERKSSLGRTSHPDLGESAGATPSGTPRRKRKLGLTRRISQDLRSAASESQRRRGGRRSRDGAEGSGCCDDRGQQAIFDNANLGTSTSCAVAERREREYRVSPGKRTRNHGRNAVSRDVHATVISHTRNSARARSPRSGNVASAENGAAPSAQKRRRPRSTSSPRYLELSAIALTSRE
jgi:hypothetical protein